MNFNTVLKYIKYYIKSTKIASDNRFVLRYEKKRLINISKVTTIMNQKAYSYVSMIIDSIEDTK